MIPSLEYLQVITKDGGSFKWYNILERQVSFATKLPNVTCDEASRVLWGWIASYEVSTTSFYAVYSANRVLFLMSLPHLSQVQKKGI